VTQHDKDPAEPVIEAPVPPPSRRSTCCAGRGCINCDGTDLLLEQPLASAEYGTDGHGGPGWYYWDSDYLDEGSVGAFATRAEAETHANEAGYRFQAESDGPAQGAAEPSWQERGALLLGAYNRKRDAGLDIADALEQIADEFPDIFSGKALT